MRRGLLLTGVALVAGALAAGFVWGYQSHRAHWFPYGLLVASVQPGLAPDPGVAGRWRLLDGRRPWILHDPLAYTAAQLEALGYAEGSLPAPDRAGVTVHTAEAWPGRVLVTSGDAPVARLLELDGTEVFTWKVDHAALFPAQRARGMRPRPYLRRAELLPDGSLLGHFVDHGMFRLRPDGTAIWTWEGAAHHDHEPDGQGGVWVLSRELRDRPEIDRSGPIVDDELVLLDLETGKERRRFALVDALQKSPFRSLIAEIRPREDKDPLHTNTVKVLGPEGVGRGPALAPGHLLVSMRHTSWVLSIDPATATVVGVWRGPWFQQHEPTITPAGTLLVFDNMGAWPRSRVLEVDPAGGAVLWAWDGGKTPLVSETCGTAQRLPNGNTLAVASDTGRAVEITPDGRIVWEYFNPARAGESGALVATLFQAERVWGPAAEAFSR
jgi:hypothetical protein